MNETKQGGGGRAIRWIYLVFSVVSAAAIFGYLFTHVSFAEVINLIRGADLRCVAAFVMLSLSMSVFRMWRYRLALNLSGFSPGSGALFLVVLVRNFFSDLLPARLGTLIYMFLVTTRLGVSLGAAASSFALAFLFDFIALAPLIAIAAWLAGAVGRVHPAAMLTGAVILGGVTTAILLVLPAIVRGCRVFAGRLRFLPAGWTQRLDAFLGDTEADLLKARGAGVYLRLLVLSVGVRVMKYASLYVFLFALLKPLGYTLGQMRVSRVFLGLCAAEAAASTPVSGIAGFGAYEGAWAVVFELLGFPGDIAKLTSISHHLFTQVYGYSLGALALLVLLLPFFKVKVAAGAGTGRYAEPAIVFYGKIAVFLAVVAGAVAALIV